MNNKIGVMQGRLLSKYKGRYQAHPLNLWQDEFKIAKTLGLSYIEFILDFNDYQENPLMTLNGVNEILQVSKNTGVLVKSICADYFMEKPLHSSDKQTVLKSKEVLIKLIKNANLIGITDIIIPCVDHSSLKLNNAAGCLYLNLQEAIILAKKNKINLALETDLGPKEFKKLLNKFDEECITVNYDLGNSASLGYDMKEEFNLYGNKISVIHIKDRIYNGGSVILGKGDVDFQLFNKLFPLINFEGPITMQAYRDEEGVEVFKKQLNWFKEIF